jgi:uncharacterized membrane protein YjgN (DUF898 family)
MRVYHFLLTIVTLGIFSFWAKTRVRRYLCSQMEFLNHRFHFHGEGKELLRGWLKGMPLLAFLFFSPRIAPVLLSSPILLAFIQFAASLGFLLLWPIARVGAYRYRMNRMSWRGIRFRFSAPTGEYFGISVIGYIQMLFTLGVASPFVANRQRQYLYNHTSIGNRSLQYTGEAGDLFWTWIFAIPMLVFSWGLGWFWWSAARSRYCWRHTTLGDARFRCTVTGRGLAWLFITNAILFVCTLGLGSSWAAMRTLRYWSKHLTLEGPLDAHLLTQHVESSSSVGESFADFIGFDFGF